ncbi:MAG: MarR family transcriptional regulator [Mobilitalea sp.]
MDNELNITEECRMDSCLFFSSAKLARVLGKIAEDKFKKTGLSPSHALLLYTVNQNGSIPQKEVGELLHLTPSTITRFVEKLKEKNFVVTQCTGKNVSLFTTEKGLLMQPEILKAWDDLHKAYKDSLTEEETRQFVESSNKMLSKLESYKD